MTRTVGNYGFAIVGSPEYFAKAGTPSAPEDLAGHVCLHHRRSTSGKLVGWRLKRDGKYLDPEIPVTMAINTVEPLVSLVEKGIGIAALPMFTVRHQLREGTLVSILDPYLNDVGVFRMMWPEGRQLLPRLRVFIDFMSKNLVTHLALK